MFKSGDRVIVSNGASKWEGIEGEVRSVKDPTFFIWVHLDNGVREAFTRASLRHVVS